jgi:hypothetical protein
MITRPALLLMLIVSVIFVGYGGANKLEQIEQGARDVERHARTIQDGSEP